MYPNRPNYHYDDDENFLKDLNDSETEYNSLNVRPPRPPFEDGQNMPPYGRPPEGERRPEERPVYPRPPRPPFEHDHGRERPPEHGGKPEGKPPRAIPAKGSSVYAIDPRSIRGCMYNYTYIWLKNGREFWFYPTYVGRQSASGYRYTQFGWAYTGFDLDLVDYFYCTV